MSAPPKHYRPISSNAGFLFASQTTSSILRALYAAVLARELGPQLFGLMNYGLGWYAAFLAVANLQLESYMSRQIALYPGKASGILSEALTLRVFSTTFVFAVAVVVALATTSGKDNLLAAVLLIFTAAMIGRSAAMWCNSAFIARENARHVFKMEVAFRVGEVLVGISALVMGFGLIAVAIIHALSWWGQSIYGFLLVRCHLSAVHLRVRLRKQVELFRAVLPIAVASIGATWLMQGPFVLFKEKASVASDLGVVALILQAYVLMAGVPVALGRASLPALSRTVARTDSKEALFLGLVLRAAISGTAALIIGAASAGPWMVSLVFGEAYRPAGLYLPYGMMLVLPFGVAMIANQILIAHDRTWQAMLSAVTGAATMTVLVLLFMPVGSGIAAYFLCIFAGMLTWSIIALALLSRLVTLNWRQCLVRPALASGLVIGLYYILARVIGPWTSLIVALGMLIAGQRIFNIVNEKERTTLSRYFLAKLGRGPFAG